ncbi:MAG: chemotaxis protein CheD [candidate division WOR-3 bacterium]|nr:chemotaxis protein CheD [candidate division WOR-3 bacterium]
MKRRIKILVKTGQFKVTGDSEVLITHGLGSCVALTLYDEKVKIGGMLHYILPENPGDGKKANYVDTGIELLIQEMIRFGTKKERLVAKLIGGAIMFEEFIKDKENSIGMRNIKKGRKILGDLGIPILSEDAGGGYGRSVEFDLSNGKVCINSYKSGIKII